MRKSIIAGFLITILAGCVTPSTVLVNREGKVMRCASYGYGNAWAIGAAEGIHSSCVRDAKLVGFVPIPMATLGIFYDAKSQPVKVTNVSQNAQTAGIKAGDIILEVDAKPIENAFSIIQIMSAKKPGDRVPMKVQRGQEVLQFSIVASSREEQ